MGLMWVALLLCANLRLRALGYPKVKGSWWRYWCSNRAPTICPHMSREREDLAVLKLAKWWRLFPFCAHFLISYEGHWKVWEICLPTLAFPDQGLMATQCNQCPSSRYPVVTLRQLPQLQDLLADQGDPEAHYPSVFRRWSHPLIFAFLLGPLVG